MSKIKTGIHHGESLAMALSLLTGLLLFNGCNQGGTSDAGIDIRNASSASLTLLSLSPASEEIQVPVSAAIQLTFDGDIHPDGLDTQVIRLRDSKGKTIAGSFLTRAGGRIVLFQPAAPLLESEDYSLSIDANLCDVGMRAMASSIHSRFRTLDKTAPSVNLVDLGGNQNSTPRTGSFQILFDERIDARSINNTTVQILDAHGITQVVDLSFSNKSLVLDLVRDLPGSANFRIRLQGGNQGIADISGNHILSDWLYEFTTEIDNKSPVLVDTDPPNGAKGVSPRARLSYLFTESLSPVISDSPVVRMFDKNSKEIPIQYDLSRDGRTLRVLATQLLKTGKTYRVHLEGGSQGLRDVSGNTLQMTYNIPFETGTDSLSPAILEQSPEPSQEGVSINARLQIGFSEPLNPTTVTSKIFQLYQGSQLITVSVSRISAEEIYLLPSKLLEPSTQYRIFLKGGYDGILDPAGNPMAGDLDINFRTGAEVTLPEFEIYPSPSSSSVPLDASITFISNAEILASSVTKDTVRIIPSGNTALPGTLTLERGNRVIRFAPKNDLPALSVITLQIKGGAKGVKLKNGNWLTTDTLLSFRTGMKRDSGSKPLFRFAFNGIDPERMGGIHLPPSGFSIDISAYDSADGAVDMSSLQLTLQGPDIVPSAQELFALTTFHGNSASLLFGKEFELPIGKYKISAKVADSAGNASDVQSHEFWIDPPMSGDVPFEATQFVHVRFDLDRENDWKGDGVPDLDGDLYDLGLLASGDPIGKNSYMRELIIDGILAVANHAYGRAADGSTLPGSVNIRFLSRKPCGNNFMQIAVGGLDPNGSSSRKFGDKTTGILGRAWYDYKNGNYRDDNTGTRPGLGVFTGELFLHQARIYLDLRKWYLSTWARTYDGLSPHLSGTPVGRHVVDSKILVASWDYQKANNTERARWDEIMRAADDFALVTGTILAHEVGHSVGLVAPGELPSGLHGDKSLHNSTSGLGNIMSPVIGYEGLLVVDHAFRGLSMSFLRQSLLLK